MTTWFKKPKSTVESQTKSFESALDEAITIGKYPSPARVDSCVIHKIYAVADEYPNPKPETIKEAKRTFEWFIKEIFPY